MYSKSLFNNKWQLRVVEIALDGAFRCLFKFVGNKLDAVYALIWRHEFVKVGEYALHLFG